MKKLVIAVNVILLFALVSFGGKTKLTLKEKIEQQGVVKVYVDFAKVIPTGNASTQSNVNNQLSFPDMYKPTANSIIAQLNTGLQSSAFTMDELKNVPTKTVMTVSVPDYTQLSSKIVASLIFTGSYGDTPSQIEGGAATRNLHIWAELVLMEIDGSKMKVLERKKLAKVDKMVSMQGMSDKELSGIFELENYFEDFNSSIEVNTIKFTKKIMEKHNKAISKRK